jgi:hypothetical protein
MSALRIKEYGHYLAGIAIRQDSESQVETPKKRWGQTDTPGRLDKGSIDLMRQSGD